MGFKARLMKIKLDLSIGLKADIIVFTRIVFNLNLICQYYA